MANDPTRRLLLIPELGGSITARNRPGWIELSAFAPISSSPVTVPGQTASNAPDEIYATKTCDDFKTYSKLQQWCQEGRTLPEAEILCLDKANRQIVWARLKQINIPSFQFSARTYSFTVQFKEMSVDGAVVARPSPAKWNPGR